MSAPLSRASPLALALLLACAQRPSIEGMSLDVADLGRGLPAGFIMGTATAAHQVEGGNDNDWTDWENTAFPDGTPHILHGDVSGLADDSWNRFDEDLALMKAMGARGYRFSVEWSRLEPSRGAWNQAAMDRYVSWARKLRAQGIEPMVTLFHFTLPKWVAAHGGWEDPATLDEFKAFSTRVVTAMKGDVDLWCTINEPNVYALEGWLEGIWPPGKKDDTKTQTEVFARLLEAHGVVGQMIHTVDDVDADGDGKAALVSVAHHVRLIQPASNSALDTFIAGVTDDYFNESTARALKTGRILLDIPGAITIDKQVDALVGSTDFLGLNYYSRSVVRADLGTASLSRQYFMPGRPTNDLGWEIYPEGLYLTLTRFASYGWPIYITENGIADHLGGTRVEFLKQHIEAVQLAVADGADVRGYFHWSLVDNFEWADGFEPRFGLYSVDYANCRARSPTAAVETFRRIAANSAR